ncbi:hypothetical protein Ahy_A09g042768 [Arachis hypogaea]|uniref:Aminotransferase-like plant mobile domain-containing protein n=1 Tax=Arachis hypogaea TaxID=3818 RepID=A0A445BGR6_ARAHY|nr:hypothetical protein Ahy_A09g042768 [Arachis hypogaea]
MGDDPGRLYRLDGVAHIAGVINDEIRVVWCVTSCEPNSEVRSELHTWFQETFEECPAGADEETVRRFTRAYIMMLLGTQLFADKSGNRVHIRWLSYVARLEEIGPLQLLQSWIFWHFSGFRPVDYDEWSGHNPSGSEKGPRVQMWRLKIDMLQAMDVSILTSYD